MINKFRLKFIFTFLLSFWFSITWLKLSESQCLSSDNKDSLLIFKVDKHGKARAFYSGLAAIPSLGGALVFFNRSLNGNRELILRGPWSRTNFEGKLNKISERKYSLMATNNKHEAEYQIIYDQISASIIELSFKIRAPKQGGNLEIEILKLSGDMFKGSIAETDPYSGSDPQRLPSDLEIYGKRNRTIIRGKNKLKLKTRFFDFELTDLNQNKSINVADFRTVEWDEFKSFNIYAIKNNLTPGGSYTFKYRIRFLSASNFDLMEKNEKEVNRVKSEIIIEQVNQWQFFTRIPKRESLDKTYYTLKPTSIIYGSHGNIAVEILAKEISNLTGFELKIEPLPIHLPVEGILIGTSLPSAREIGSLPAEGFEISATETRISIHGQDMRGCIYGVYSLLGRFMKNESNWILQTGTVKDWPDIKIRGICTVPVNSAVQDTELYKRYINAFSRARSNLVIFYHRPEQIFAWKKGNKKRGWRKEQMAEVARYARSLQMDVWAGMGTNFKAGQFPGLEIKKATKFYNPFAESSYRFLFSLYEVLLQTYQPSTLLIGHDEIYGLSVYASESKSTADILAMDVKKIYNWLQERGVETAMFGDMLLDHSRWNRSVGSAHSNQKFRNSGKTDKAIEEIPKNVKIFDWHYAEKPEYPSINYFRKKGFQVLGCTWHNSKTAKAMALSVKLYGGQGVVGTDWGLWRTLSPASTTLYSVLCGWSNKCAIGQKNDDVQALAHILESSDIDKKSLKQDPIKMTSTFNASTFDLVPHDNEGVFDLGPMLDLRNFPDREKKIEGILFNLNSADLGYRNNCVVVGFDDSGKLSPTEHKSINFRSARTDGLALLHTAYFLEPRHLPRKIGRYTIEYADGSSTSISLIEGWNITDVRSSIGLRKFSPGFQSSPDILAGARLAWRGQSVSGLPLNVQMLLWKNPFPNKKIKNMIISAHRMDQNQNFRIALLAVTLLKKKHAD